MILLAIGIGLGVLVGVRAAVRRWRRRTRYLPLERMSDAWVRSHAADPVPDHLR